MSRVLLAAVMVALAAAAAAAEPVRVGVFVPATPFEGAGARLEFANRLAAHIGGGQGVGKVYGRAGDFASALRKGDIDVAVVEASYLASTTASVAVVAVAVRGGDTRVGWELVARSGAAGAAGLLGLAGKKVLVPSVGGREREFVLEAMLGGELPADFFRVEASPDVLSAVTALGLGKADAAVVPGGLTLPAGVTRVTTLPAVSWPVLVVSAKATAAVQALAAERALSFGGSGAITGFRAASADAYRGLARRFGRPVRRGPLVIPAVRLAVGVLIDDRTFAIEPGDLRRYAAPPVR